MGIVLPTAIGEHWGHKLEAGIVRLVDQARDQGDRLAQQSQRETIGYLVDQVRHCRTAQTGPTIGHS